MRNGGAGAPALVTVPYSDAGKQKEALPLEALHLRRCEKLLPAFWKNLHKKIEKIVDIRKCLLYNINRVTEECIFSAGSGCGSVWLECLIWDQDVAGSNPVTPICRLFESAEL